MTLARWGRLGCLGALLGILSAAVPARAELSAVWANDGGDKVTRSELRASRGQPVLNRIWDGAGVSLLAARNEVVSFYLVLEAANALASEVSVRFDALVGPGGATIASEPASGNGVFDWTRRPIELFYVRYLQIVGLSSDLHFGNYDERHIPERFRRPWSGDGEAAPGSGWSDRPDHDAFYPDIAVPLELVPAFDIAAGQNQGIWVDVYVPIGAASGRYTGTLEVSESGSTAATVSVDLEVFEFALPEQPTAATMVYVSYEDVAGRYTGAPFPECGSDADLLEQRVRDRHFQLAHRHRVSLIDDNTAACDWPEDAPRPEWAARLDGSLFTPGRGYAGPGLGVGNGVFSIGTYGGWSWQDEGEAGMRLHTDAWESWFRANSPATERFLYLTDEPEPEGYAQVEQWAGWIENNPGPGNALKSFCTMPAPDALGGVPSLDIPASWITVGPTEDWANAVAAYEADPSRRVFLYNGNRPADGSFAIEDDGVALRVLEWARFKKGVDRWFFWQSTYYDNYQGNTGQTDVFQRAHTFGDDDGFDPVLGRNGFNYGNGDGVLFYPGTDRVFPGSSYGVEGPFASLRLKQWRRGIQDVEYLTAAARVDSGQVAQIVNRIVPTVLWEYGVTDPGDPSYVLTDISWSNDPDVWEAARCELARIIDPSLETQC